MGKNNAAHTQTHFELIASTPPQVGSKSVSPSFASQPNDEVSAFSAGVGEICQAKFEPLLWVAHRCPFGLKNLLAFP
jgi:hypothetical protein